MKDLKFLFIGLANAGKTSILRTLDNDFEKIPSLTPTAGVAYNTFKVMGFTIAAWDLGGQLKYRKKYLQDNERYFQEASATFYVFDTQAKDEFKEALAYLESIRDAFKDLKQEEVPVTILLHKYDPHIRGKVDGIENDIAALKANVDKILGKTPHVFFETSIYEAHSIYRAFSEAVLTYVPNRDMIGGKLYEISTEFNSKISILLDSAGYIYGQWHSKDAQLLQLSKFIRMSQEFARLTTKETYSEFTLLKLDEISDIAISSFPVEDELFLFGMLVPHAWLEQDIKMQENFTKKTRELAKILKIFE
jgi:small GTP-binding protein